MINMYKTVDENGSLAEIKEIEPNSWIDLVNPTDDEINYVADKVGINNLFLKYPLDSEEQARIDVEDDQVLIIVDIPTIESHSQNIVYSTMPLGVLIVRDMYVITISLKKVSIFDEFKLSKVKFFFTNKKTRFVLQILFRVAQQYLRYLKLINKETEKIEQTLYRSMQNKEMIKLLNIEKSLVYFTTSLKANEIVLERLQRGKIVKFYEEDEDILEDTIIENKQAIEMAQIHSDILSGMMDAFASIISNNLNVVMKFLTGITIVLSVPAMVASFFGMNVKIPFFADMPMGFLAIVIGSIAISFILALALKKRDML